ncbi:MAG: N-acetyltransferase family protein [Kordiimonas sp.]
MVKIREARTEDFPHIWPIFERIMQAQDAYAFDPNTSQEEAFTIWMTRPLKTFVAENEGKILGSYYIVANKSGPGKHVSNCGYMVSENARGQGIAKLMCEHSQQVAVDFGFKAMQFNMVVSSNAPAVKLWQKLGFDIVGTIPRAFNHAELGFVDAYVMYKWLAD